MSTAGTVSPLLAGVAGGITSVVPSGVGGALGPAVTRKLDPEVLLVRAAG
ncbi:hypothetical protein [Dactylosporangium sp. NPDC005555]